MRVTLLASADFAVPTLNGLLAAGHEVIVGTQPARPAGRGRSLRPTAIGKRCDELGLPARQLEDVNEPESLQWLTDGQPDLIVVVAFGQKLGPAVRSAAPWGCINIHPSLLPRWRGAAPVQAAVLAGDEETGVCIIDVVERMDAGAVLAVRTTKVDRKSAKLSRLPSRPCRGTRTAGDRSLSSSCSSAFCAFARMNASSVNARWTSLNAMPVSRPSIMAASAPRDGSTISSSDRVSPQKTVSAAAAHPAGMTTHAGRRPARTASTAVVRSGLISPMS